MGKCFSLWAVCNWCLMGTITTTQYYRELDIEKAVAKTVYTVDDVTYTREVLASFPDQVIAMRLTANKPGRISFAAYFTTLQSNAVS